MIYLIFTSSSKHSLMLYSDFLLLVFKKLKIENTNSGILIRKKRISLLKSPHVYKKSKEHFEINNFRICFCIKDFDKADFFIFKYILQNKPNSLTLKVRKIKE